MFCEFNLHTEIVFGKGSLSILPEKINSVGGSKILVVTDEGVKNAGICDNITIILNQNNYKYIIYDKVEPNPGIKTIENGLQMFEENNCNMLISVGGGSSIDTAKAISATYVNKSDLYSLEGLGKVKGPLVPHIAIPTTSGTGSEVTKWTVISDYEKHYKISIGGNCIMPTIAILDPILTETLPPKLTVSTALDALTHALESYTNLLDNPICDLLSLKAVRLINDNLRLVMKNPRAIKARENLMLASLMGGIAFSNNRLGLVHAMSQPLGSYCNLAHGIANAILLPYVLEFNYKGCVDKLCIVAEALGLKNDDNKDEYARTAINAIISLCYEVGIPKKISQLTIITEEMIPKMAEDAMRSGNIPVNPQTVTKEDVIQIYKDAM